MRKILLAGFGPFGDDPVNAAIQVVRTLDGTRIMDAEIIGRELPVIARESLRLLETWISELRPSIIVVVGQAEGRAEITPERVAINVDDFQIPDNRGAQPIDKPVVRGGPDAYWSTLPVKAMVEAMLRDGVPARVSNSAGTYVCNHVFYGLMHHLASGRAHSMGGFVHVPLLPEQAARRAPMPSMGLEVTSVGLRLAVTAALAHCTDSK